MSIFGQNIRFCNHRYKCLHITMPFPDSQNTLDKYDSNILNERLYQRTYFKEHFKKKNDFFSLTLRQSVTYSAPVGTKTPQILDIDINYEMTAHVIMTFHILAAVLLEVEKPFDELPTNFRFFLANMVPTRLQKLSFLPVADSVP